jgi:hypothetical protein
MNDVQSWRTYEEVAEYLLNRMAEQFGLTHVEGSQTLEGKISGTDWNIEAKGVNTDDEAFFIVECRRYTTSRIDQESVGALAWRIIDTGAQGGIIVTPLGLQEGARKVAASRNIEVVLLDPRSTAKSYIMRIIKGASIKGIIGISMDAHLVRGDDPGADKTPKKD